MITYLPEPIYRPNTQYTISYQNLKERYINVCSMSDKEFIEKIWHIVHLISIISWFKEIPMEYIVGDLGLIHEISHHMCFDDGSKPNIEYIRKMFNEQCELI